MPLLGLRHVALRVCDPQVSKAFYRECFDMHVVWEPDADNVYLTSGTDNLALHRASSEGAARAGQGVAPGALDHLGIIVRSAADVDRWASFLESRGVVLAAQPRTHRDGARSFYFKDPDGNGIQIIHHPPISQKL